MINTLKQACHRHGYGLESDIAGEDRDISFTYDKSAVFMRINCSNQPGQAGVTEVFSALAKAGIAVDMVSVQPCQISFTVQSRLADLAAAALAKIAVQPDMITDCVKLSVRGRCEQPLLSTIITVTEILARANVPLLRLAESYGLIEGLIAPRHISAACKALARQFTCYGQGKKHSCAACRQQP
ncbi:ACT domain-containing protein [Sporomusa termitida]|uniref:aspartate kinase n=1 Tax=Sporomusa termitida TaxID=2377 RepID=A0A517DQU4_9FIRM|nr:hypothetical protein [Sporomusa termitida]QDR79688.1 hypothetical protein SPTER_09780 [Sporomusa termitida]